MLNKLFQFLFGLLVTVFRIYALKVLFNTTIAVYFGLPVATFFAMASVYLFVNGLVGGQMSGFVQLILDQSYFSQLANPKPAIDYAKVPQAVKAVLFNGLQLISIAGLLVFVYFVG
jgi:hypothetical protein